MYPHRRDVSWLFFRIASGLQDVVAHPATAGCSWGATISYVTTVGCRAASVPSYWAITRWRQSNTQQNEAALRVPSRRMLHLGSPMAHLSVALHASNCRHIYWETQFLGTFFFMFL